jgi:hypothetical protein
MLRLLVLFACAVGAALIVAGCGSGGDSNTASITKAQFVKQADAACKKGEEQIQADFKAYIEGHKNLTNPTEDDFAEVVDTVLAPNVEQEVGEIRALGMPSGDEAKIEAILDSVEEGREEAEADPKNAIQTTPASLEKANKLAKEYGLKVCGSR